MAGQRYVEGPVTTLALPHVLKSDTVLTAVVRNMHH